MIALATFLASVVSNEYNALLRGKLEAWLPPAGALAKAVEELNQYGSKSE
jgi:hypothetical protein